MPPKKQQPVETSSEGVEPAEPAQVVDALAEPAEVVETATEFDTPYGKMTWEQIMEMARAGAAAQANSSAELAGLGPVELIGGQAHGYDLEAQKEQLGPICERCFEGGWAEHPSAKNSDAVTCEHGTYKRKS